jgi:hypothetical protein
MHVAVAAPALGQESIPLAPQRREVLLDWLHALTHVSNASLEVGVV